MRRPAWIAIGAAAALAAAMPAAGSGVQRSSNRSAIVFATNRDGGSSLQIVNPNGSSRQRLTSGAGFDLAPAWSPGRGRVAFASTRQSGTVSAQDIYLVNADGTDLRPLVETNRDESAPSWSPDGRWIVFERDTNGTGRYDLYLVSLDTGRTSRLTSAIDDEGAPSWSPNARWIAYSREGEIWLIRPSGTRAHALGRLGSGIDWGPDWSPDSRHIAFESTSRTSASRPTSGIWVMRADGSGKRRLTPYSRKHPVRALSPSWSPSGAQIVYTRGSQLWTIRPDGHGARQLTRPPGVAWSGDW